MFDETMSRAFDRRSFLRGSALFATALGLSVAPALAQQPQHKPKPEDEKEKSEKPKEGKLIDKEGREYRVCPQCAYNMYKQGRMWVCENCGYSYVE